MRFANWKKTATIAMKQHGFQKNIINHKFYCEWPHCLAVAVFEEHKESSMMKVRLDIYVYRLHEMIDVSKKADTQGYLSCGGNEFFALDKDKEAVYDEITQALKESIPKLIASVH